MLNTVIPSDKVMINVRNVFSASTEDTYQLATVVDILSTQFTAELADGHVVYRFYRDIGRSWRMV